MLTLEEVREALELLTATAYSSDSTLTSSVVVDEGVNSFLEHALFVSADNFRSFEDIEFLETVVTVDDSSVEVVQV